jgi:mono/diheme cytochrome c family protein
MIMTSHPAALPDGRAPLRRDAIAACVLAIALSLAGTACAPDERPAAVASAADSAPAATAGPEVALATPDAERKPAADVAASASRAGTDSSATTVPKPASTAAGTASQSAATGARPASARTASVSAGTVRLRATAPAQRAPAPAARETAVPARAPDTAAAEPAPAAPQRDSLAVTQAEYNGWKNFAVNCTRCHGEDGIGSAIAPSLLKSLQESVTREVFVQTVTFGRPEKGMPPWRTLLSDAQIEQLYLYLKARSEGRLAPGRPHVKPAQE